MTAEDATFLLDTRHTFFKMTKTRTAMFLVMITLSCALVFSITEAYPTPEAEPLEDTDTKLSNSSRLVITHVVKTIEFEVGVMDENDDGTLDLNSTDSDSSEFYETDIQLLNVDLLKEVVKQANGEVEDPKEESSSPAEQKQNATEKPSH